MADAVAVEPAPAAAPPVAEAPKPEPVAEPAAADPSKPKPGDFAAKAKAERERVQAAQAGKALQAERDALKTQLDTARGELDKITQRRQSYVQNPVQALMDAFPGMEPIKAFELISEAAKTGKTPPSAETYALQQRLEEMDRKLSAKVDADEKAQRQAAADQAKQTEAQFRQEIADFVKENAETYELTSLYQQEDTVFAVIDEHWRKTKEETGEGEILTKKAAAELVEKRLEELADKALKSKKIGAKLKAEPPKTLTNDLATKTTAEGRGMSERERMARAAEAIDRLGGLK